MTEIVIRRSRITPFVRRFSPEYLRDTRRGLWDDRSPLEALHLQERVRILDVGAGTGEFTRVLQEESEGRVVAVDADHALLQSGVEAEAVVGDATRLPFASGAFDLVVCQALLVNLPEPTAAIREFTRVSSGLVAAIEPDNSEVTVESTVASESQLSAQARQYYMAGLDTDASLGGQVSELFTDAGITGVSTARWVHERSVEPPYSTAALESAKRKATGSRLAEQRATMLRSGLRTPEFESLLDEWRAMGRDIVEQMSEGTYRRTATVPFYVTVGESPADDRTST